MAIAIVTFPGLAVASSTVPVYCWRNWRGREVSAVTGTRGPCEVNGQCLVFVQIFRRYIVLRNFMGVNFFFFGVPGVFHTRHCLGLEGVAFFEQLVDTFGICPFDIGQSLKISRLPRGTCSCTLPRE